MSLKPNLSDWRGKRGWNEGRNVRMHFRWTGEQPDEVVKLIRKLRWIGLEREARELQHVLEGSSSPPRGSLVAGPHSTD